MRLRAKSRKQKSTRLKGPVELLFPNCECFVAVKPIKDAMTGRGLLDIKIYVPEGGCRDVSEHERMVLEYSKKISPDKPPTFFKWPGMRPPDRA